MKRRTFIKTISGAASVAALGVSQTLLAAERVQGVPRRALGNTGKKLSVIGFPGLALVHYDQEKCTRSLHQAFDQGLNYFDVAPAYGEGQCEIKMGIGLQGLDRDKYFLACKTKKRDAEGCLKELESSLKALKTDHFDLYQLHHLVRPADVEKALGAGGAMETILKAKDQGKIRHIGFSAHTTKSALQALRDFKFDTVMFPVNFVELYTRDFGRAVLDLAQERDTAVLAIKPLSWGTWKKEEKKTREWWYRTVETKEDVELALRFALSQPGVAAAIPPSFVDLLEHSLEAVRNFRPLDEPAVATLKKMAENRDSIFLREEQLVAQNLPSWAPVYPDSPHEACEGHIG